MSLFTFPLFLSEETQQFCDQEDLTAGSHSDHVPFDRTILLTQTE